MNKIHFEGKTFEEVFIDINKEITENPEYTFESRIGDTYEVTNITFEVTDPTSYHILNPKINRIKYSAS